MSDEGLLFQKNIQLWAKSSPKQAVLLPYVEVHSLKFCQTQKAELNLRKKNGRKVFLLHPAQGAAVAAKAWFDALSLEGVSLLTVYGVGLGYYYEAAAKWLKKDPQRRMLFLEDDLAVIYKLFETTGGSRLLNDPQVQLVYFQELQEEEIVFEQLYWNYAMTRFCVSALKSYQKEKKERFLNLQRKISYDAAMKNALVDEYTCYGVSFYRNFYQNMLALPQSFLGNKLFNKFKNIPAIICGAGPSLEKNRAQLSGLSDQALLFAGGSAMNVLNAGHILPHFGVAIDPNPTQLERLKNNKAQSVPYFYRSRLYHEALKMIEGPRLYITGTGGYDTAEYFEHKLGIASAAFLDEGHNVINFCTQIAQALGCNPILYVGMDLAFTEMREYAQGVKEDVEVKRDTILTSDDPDESALLRQDIYGASTYTLWKWIAESDWIGNFAAEHPEITWINCTEGGIGFPHIPNQPLKKTAALYLKKKHKLTHRIAQEIEKSALSGVTRRKIARAMKELQKSLHRCEKNLQILLEELDTAKLKVVEGAKEITPSGRGVLAETDLAEEPAYKHVLDVFNELSARLLSREFHEIHLGKRSLKQRLLKRMDLSRKVYVFLRNTAQVNAELIEYALKNG